MEDKPQSETLLGIIIAELYDFSLNQLKSHKDVFPTAVVAIKTGNSLFWGAPIWNYAGDAYVNDVAINYNNVISPDSKPDLHIEIYSRCTDAGSIWVNSKRFGSIFENDSIDKLKSVISETIKAAADSAI